MKNFFRMILEMFLCEDVDCEDILDNTEDKTQERSADYDLLNRDVDDFQDSRR